MIGNTTTRKKAFSYNGVPCYEIEATPVNIAGFGAAAPNVETLPSCNSLRNAAKNQMSRDTSLYSNFDPLTWLKENKLTAAAIAAAAYFVFFKK